MPLTRTEKVLEGFALLFLLCLVIIPISLYPQLPPTVPLRFTLDGTPYQWTSKGSLFVISILSAWVYLFTTLAAFMPASFYSIPTPKGQEVTPFRYLTARMMVRVLKAAFMFLFIFVELLIVTAAYGTDVKYLHWLVIAYLINILGICVIFTVRMYRGQE
jgi:uncharacterized membrane protein